MTDPETGAGPAHRRRPSAPPELSRRLLVGGLAAAVPVYLALEGGGYDLLFRSQFGIALWWLLALGFAFGVVPRSRPAGEQRLAMALLAGLAAWVALGWLTGTESRGRTYEELGRIATYGGLFALAWAGLGPRTWRDAAIGLSVGVLAIAALAVLSRLTPGLFEPVASPQVLYLDRLTYPLGYWNAVAAWCAIAFCLGLAWSAHARSSIAREAALAALPLAGVGVYLTYSRAGIAALLIGIGAVVLLARNRVAAAVHAAAALAATTVVVLVVRGQPAIADGTGGEGGWVVGIVLVAAALVVSRAAPVTRRLGWAGARARPPRGPWAIAAAAAAIAAAAVAIGPSSAVPPAEDLSGAGQPILHDDPAARLGDLEGTRGRIWGSALRAFASDPLTGTGGGSFQLWWQRDVAEGEPVRNAHSLYLETLAELGAPGLLLLAGFLAALVVGAARTRSAAESAAGVAAATGLLAASVVLLFHAGVDWLWQFPALVVVGIGAALVAAAGRASSGRRGRIAGTTRVGLVCLAVIAGAVQVPLAVSASGVRSAQTALSLGHYERAAELAGQAISAQPWAAEPYALRAFVALADERPVAARADIREAIEREPTNWRHRLLLVRATSELGDKEAALRALEALERLRPGLAEEIGELRREVEADRPLE